MYRKIIVALALGSALWILGCSAEDLGRRMDPGYENYIENRSSQQEIIDQTKQEKIKADFAARKSNEESIRKFNDKVNAIAKTKNDEKQDSTETLLGNLLKPSVIIYFPLRF